MKYIPDKNLYKAVMFFLSMCPDIHWARDEKIAVAANYYKVNQNDVLRIVKDELWEKAKNEACLENGWYTIFNPYAPKILGTGFGKDYVWICPSCGHVQAANVHDELTGDRIFISPCPSCGFVDKNQFFRKDKYHQC